MANTGALFRHLRSAILAATNTGVSPRAGLFDQAGYCLLDAVRLSRLEVLRQRDRGYIPTSGNSERMSGKTWSGGGTLGCRSMLRRLIQHTVRPSDLPPTMSVNCD